MRLTTGGLEAKAFKTTMRAIPDGDISSSHVIDDQHVFSNSDDYEDWLSVMWGVSAVDKDVDFIRLHKGILYAPAFSTTMRYYPDTLAISDSHVIDENHTFSAQDDYEDFVEIMYGITAGDITVDKTRIYKDTVYSQNFEEVV